MVDIFSYFDHFSLSAQGVATLAGFAIGPAHIFSPVGSGVPLLAAGDQPCISQFLINCPNVNGEIQFSLAYQPDNTNNPNNYVGINFGSTAAIILPVNQPVNVNVFITDSFLRELCVAQSVPYSRSKGAFLFGYSGTLYGPASLACSMSISMNVSHIYPMTA